MADPDPTAAAHAAIQNYCGWHIAPVVTDVVTVRGSGSGSVMLPSMHVTAVGSVTVDGVALSVSDYVAWPWGEIQRTGAPLWFSTRQLVTVEFTHGYAEWPADVEGVAARLAKGGLGTLGSGSVRVGQVQVQMSPAAAAGAIGLDEFSAAILGKYRIPRL